MDAEQLDHQYRTCTGWLSLDVVEALIERGRLDLLRREAAAGDFACAEALAKLHLAQDEPDAALALYQPYADTGWPVAVNAIGMPQENASPRCACGIEWKRLA